MYFLYNILVQLTGFALKGVAFFNKKMALFVAGRKDVFKTLQATFEKNDRVIWFHCASLGEFEQGRPVIEQVRNQFNTHKILVTFFSPSGYEIRKDYDGADLVTYLPLDTQHNARRFLELAHPEMAIFIKYEFWPNFLKQLKGNGIPILLVSGIFRKDQTFFKWYGGWMKKALHNFDHFFVQDIQSEALLKTLGFTNITKSGDTRFDRVHEITRQPINLIDIEDFRNNKLTLIAGSTWPKDEELLVKYINHSDDAHRFIIAPHNIKPGSISELENSIRKKTMLFTEIEKKKHSEYQVLIINTIGLLSKIYKYADIVYVGGGFGVGIHNILEPATFSVPVLIGPNFKKFKEANDLVGLGACFVVNDYEELSQRLGELFADEEQRKGAGKLAGDYVLNNVGATQMIMDYLSKIISKK